MGLSTVMSPIPFSISALISPLISRGVITQALLDDEHLRAGLNVHSGRITCIEVAQDLGYEYVSALDALNN